MNPTHDTNEATSTGHKLGSPRHLDRHYFALQKEYEDTLRSAGFQRGWRVLDAGSGNGVFLPLLCEILGKSGRVDAVDLAPENIAQIESLAAAGKLSCPVAPRVGDLTVLPFDDHQFDGLWSANVTQYLTDEQLTRAMREFRRVVKPNGVIAIKEVDISVWQFQPQPPALMWRLLSLESQTNTQVAGALRGTRLPAWFREAGLVEVVSKTTLAERRHPLRPVERDFIQGNLEFLSKLAATQSLPENDAQEWRAIGENPDVLINHPDFCYRELYVLSTGRVAAQ